MPPPGLSRWGRPTLSTCPGRRPLTDPAGIRLRLRGAASMMPGGVRTPPGARENLCGESLASAWGKQPISRGRSACCRPGPLSGRWGLIGKTA